MFRTYEPARDRLVAVKAFHLDFTPEQARAFADELRRVAAAGLDHPSIVRPLAAGVEATIPYAAGEYVAAESLDIAMRHYAPAGVDTVLPFITQLAGAIDFARTAGIGHGALHPRDIFVTPDEARANGFGVVQALEALGRRAPVRRPYSAPERVAGSAWDARADVYSLGAIAYELLTGRRPVGADLGDLGATAGPYAEAVAAALSRALADDPAERYPSALAFAAALEASSRGGRTTGAIEEVRRVAEEEGPSRTLVVEPDDLAVAETYDPFRGDVAIEREDDLAEIQLREGDDAGTDGLSEPLRESAEGRNRPPREAPAESAARPALSEPPLEAAEGRPRPPREAPEESAASPALSEPPRESAEGRNRPPREAPAESAARPALSEPPLEAAEGRNRPPREAAGESAASPALSEPPLDAAEGRPRPPREAAGESAASLGLSEPPRESAEGRNRPPREDKKDPLFDFEQQESGEAGIPEVQHPMVADFTRRQEPEPENQEPGEPWEPRDVREPVLSRSRPRPVLLPVALTLLLGLFVGFLAGYLVGARDRGEIAATEGATQDALGSQGSEDPAQRAVPQAGPREPTEPAERGEPARPTEPRERVAPAPAARPVRGRLVVRSTPTGASVFLNGRRRGSTPLALRELAPGSYALRVTRSGFRDDVRRVSVTAGAVRDVTIRLQRAQPPRRPAVFTGSIYVDSRPRGARVLLDGRRIGVTPLQVGDIRAGTHVIRLELAGHRPWSTSARVVAGEVARISGSLERQR